jgi:transportin-1
MSWQPQQQGLDEVLEMLRQTSSKENDIQRAVAQVGIDVVLPLYRARS